MNEDYLSNALGAAAQSLLALRLVKIIPITTPAAGADFTIKVPGGVIWEPISLTFNFTASAAVASRIISIEFGDGANRLVRTTASQAMVAGGGYRLTFHKDETGLLQGVSNAGWLLPLPQIPLFSTYTISSVTTAMDVSDAITIPFLVVREWSELDIVQEMADIVERFDSITSRLVR